MKKSLIIKIVLFVLVVGLDMLTKFLFQDKTYPFLAGFISIKSVPLNTGAAWSMLSDHTWLLILLSVLLIVGIIVFDIFFKNKSKLYSVAIAFIMGGAIGNLIDRIFLGGVRDFIVFDFWKSFPVFNLADSFLFVGVVILIIYILFFYNAKKEKQNGKC